MNLPLGNKTSHGQQRLLGMRVRFCPCTAKNTPEPSVFVPTRSLARGLDGQSGLVWVAPVSRNGGVHVSQRGGSLAKCVLQNWLLRILSPCVLGQSMETEARTGSFGQTGCMDPYTKEWMF
jgi:hypothetical protein